MRHTAGRELVGEPLRNEILIQRATAKRVSRLFIGIGLVACGLAVLLFPPILTGRPEVPVSADGPIALIDLLFAALLSNWLVSPWAMGLSYDAARLIAAALAVGGIVLTAGGYWREKHNRHGATLFR